MKRSLLLLGLAQLCLPAAAAPTGLNTIPTADLIPVHNFTVSLQNGNMALAGAPTLWSKPQPVPQFQFGLTTALEGGVDFVPAHPPASDYQPQFNLKWRALAEGYGRPALGIGFAQLGPGVPAAYYLVASRTLNYTQIQYQKFRAHHRNIKLRGRRLHAGLIWQSGAAYPLLGTDWELSDQFVFYSDWISGSQNALSLGGVYVISTDASVTGSVLFTNHRHRFDGLIINYSRTFKW